MCSQSASSQRECFLHGGIADDQARRQWQNPEAILADIALEPGSTFIDLGCGTGFFALPAARIVGKSGKVYGLDIGARSIRSLEESASREGLQNLKLMTGKAEEIIMCQKCADIVFLGIVLHDFQDPARVLGNARQMLKPSGRLVNLDWKKEPMPIGPPLGKRFSEQEAVRLIETAGFTIDRVADSGAYHYLIIARPSAQASKLSTEG